MVTFHCGLLWCVQVLWCVHVLSSLIVCVWLLVCVLLTATVLRGRGSVSFLLCVHVIDQ